ncbi:2-nitropropane dioxygenase [Phlyctema vagabunda]|uniref:2-nitropropane dioxygenase n=1 Tax=Phlyctema vagabunda TaxID=108571 RepID=A0ABR4PY63_9HELO
MSSQLLQRHYPWTTTPLISSAPMRLISTTPLALAVSQASGLGFLGIGTDSSVLSDLLASTASALSNSPISNVPEGILPIGVGFIIWGASLPTAIAALSAAPLKPAAIWLFAPESSSDLEEWTSSLRDACKGRSRIWIQVGTVSTAVEVARSCTPDVLVIQGSDAGGHGLAHSSSIISLLPECEDRLAKQGFKDIPLIAAGGISDGRGVAAALMLGASGVCLGTRFLASPEAAITQGYRDAVVSAHDGGVSTKRSSVYDQLRGTTGWPKEYNGRGVLNQSFRDFESGMDDGENKKLYEEALRLGDAGWGEKGRLTTYAGTAVGLVKKVMPAGEIVQEVLKDSRERLRAGAEF